MYPNRLVYPQFRMTPSNNLNCIRIYYHAGGNRPLAARWLVPLHKQQFIFPKGHYTTYQITRYVLCMVMGREPGTLRANLLVLMIGLGP